MSAEKKRFCKDVADPCFKPLSQNLLERLTKTAKTLVSIENGTGYLPNARLQHYRYTNPLCMNEIR
jgi:hypothetical protein